ncbi:hypothetical protein [Rhizobium sp. PP-CC-3G-465]|uniref:hypothetical protein n=1 Tax=Rhizobium sp. PP-CC-3G-465 TaxID=2135648 RepID=UPI0014043065
MSLEKIRTASDPDLKWEHLPFECYLVFAEIAFSQKNAQEKKVEERELRHDEGDA